jgi:AraC family transcriptional regulator
MAMSGIVYEQEQLSRRQRAIASGAEIELVTVPPVAHAFVHESTSHLLMFTEKGKRADGESRADGQDASTMRNTSGTFSLLPAGMRYSGWTIAVLPAEYLALAIEPSSPLLEALPAPGELWNTPIVYARQLPAGLSTTLQRLRQSFASADAYSRLYRDALLSVLMIELLRWLRGRTAEPSPPGGLPPRQTRLVCDFIRADLSRDVSLAELAQLCGLSTSHFATAFRIATGLPPHRYQLACRVDLAKAMLADPATPIIDVAFRTGFSTPSGFAAAFRREVGVAPRDYRRALA